MKKIEWLDAASESKWTEFEDLIEPIIVETIGYLVKEAEDHKVICGSISETEQYGDCLAIPIGMILKERDIA